MPFQAACLAGAAVVAAAEASPWPPHYCSRRRSDPPFLVAVQIPTVATAGAGWAGQTVRAAVAAAGRSCPELPFPETSSAVLDGHRGLADYAAAVAGCTEPGVAPGGAASFTL